MNYLPQPPRGGGWGVAAGCPITWPEQALSLSEVRVEWLCPVLADGGFNWCPAPGSELQATGYRLRASNPPVPLRSS